MQLEFVSLFLILTLFSLLVVVTYIVSRREQIPGAMHLSAFLMAMFCSLGNFLYVSMDGSAAPRFAFLGNTLGLATAPLLYLYSKRLVGRSSGHAWLHFVPVLILLVGVISEYTLADLPTRAALIHDPSGESVIFGSAVPTAISLYVAAYLVSTLLLLQRYQLRLREYYSGGYAHALTWLRISVCGAVVLWGLSFLHQLAVMRWPIRTLDQIMAAAIAVAAFAVALYFLAHALRHTGFDDSQLESDLGHEHQPSRGRKRDDPQKYGIHRLSADQLRVHTEKLSEVMADRRPFLDPDVTLAELASMLPVSARDLSQTLNRQFGLSFYEYVNQARIAWATELLRSQPDRSVVEIMLECGFTSKSSFYAAFRKVTGKTPTQHRARSFRST